jgi:branched-chain amino acid transport system ATP-binding protein
MVVKLLLQVRGIESYYGKLKALQGINLEMSEGQVLAVIGPNGAGKSTLLNSIFGAIEAKRGQILFNEKNIVGYSTQKILREGISLVPQGRMLFPNLTVEENLLIGGYALHNKPTARKKMKNAYEAFPLLNERRNQMAGTLSGGEQQILSIARALMVDPKLLLMDEPTLGLAARYTREILKIMKELNSRGTSVLLAEQNAVFALQGSNEAYVIEAGQVKLKGKSTDLLVDPIVKKIYLGETSR